MERGVALGEGGRPVRQLAEAGLQLPGAVLELGQAAVELGRAGAQLLEAVRELPGAVGEGVGPVLRLTDPALQLLRARGHGVGAVVEVRQIRLGGGGDVVLDEALDALVGGRGGRGGLLGAAGDGGHPLVRAGERLLERGVLLGLGERRVLFGELGQGGLRVGDAGARAVLGRAGHLGDPLDVLVHRGDVGGHRVLPLDHLVQAGDHRVVELLGAVGHLRGAVGELGRSGLQLGQPVGEVRGALTQGGGVLGELPGTVGEGLGAPARLVEPVGQAPGPVLRGRGALGESLGAVVGLGGAVREVTRTRGELARALGQLARAVVGLDDPVLQPARAVLRGGRAVGQLRGAVGGVHHARPQLAEAGEDGLEVRLDRGPVHGGLDLGLARVRDGADHEAVGVVSAQGDLRLPRCPAALGADEVTTELGGDLQDEVVPALPQSLLGLLARGLAPVEGAVVLEAFGHVRAGAQRGVAALDGLVLVDDRHRQTVHGPVGVPVRGQVEGAVDGGDEEDEQQGEQGQATAEASQLVAEQHQFSRTGGRVRTTASRGTGAEATALTANGWPWSLRTSRAAWSATS